MAEGKGYSQAVSVLAQMEVKMIYDCIPFFNELDILKLRMQIMAPYVDKFVLEESTVTFPGSRRR